MRVVALDVETYPDLFTLSAQEIYTEEEYVYWRTKDASSHKSFRDFLQELNADIIVSYNGITFDSPVINYATDIYDPEKVASFAQVCATDRKKRSEDEHMWFKRYAYKYTGPLTSCKHIDLLLIFNKIDRVSLKRLAVSIGWHKIQDLPYPPGSLVADKLQQVLDYNMNDVHITAKIYALMYEEIKLRFDISNQYGIDVLSSSRSVMGMKIMEKLYLDIHPELNSYRLRDMRTHHTELDFKDVVSDRVSFKTANLQKLHEEITSLKFSSPDGVKRDHIKFDTKVLIGKTTYAVGMGGLHSEHTPEYVYSSKKQKIIDADVASFYPRLMLQERVYPKHLGKEFLNLFERIVTQRLEAKRGGIKIIAEALKITINAVFGKMGGIHEWFYDLKALYSVTINGQLFLLMLIEDLTEAGFDVFYGNTDGVTALVPPEKEDEFYAICKAWEAKLGFELEYAEIERMMLRDVNNYTLKLTNGYVKEKGDFIREPKLGKKVDAFIVAQAVHEWFYNDTPIADTIESAETILPFIMTGKVGPQFDAVFHTIAFDNSELIEIPLQRVNRYYASQASGSGSILKKRKKDGGFENMLKHSQVHLCNDFSLPMLPINYRYYIERTRRLISVFETQQTLF